MYVFPGWLYTLSTSLDSPIVWINNSAVNMPSMSTRYISALYFTCTSLASVGFGNIAPNTDAEKVFSICAMLVGGEPSRLLAVDVK